MHAQVEKSKENRSRAAANSVAQKKSDARQGLEFVDNRLETRETAQRQAKLRSGEHNRQSLLVTQLAANKLSEEGGAGSTYKVAVYEDQASNFKGGATAGDDGLWPIGTGKIKGEYHNGINWVGIPNGEETIQQGVSEYYFCGHMLADSLGGLGGSDNIFAQDTNNNIGRWPTAEGAIRAKRDTLKSTDNMKVTIGLAGRDGAKLQNVKIKGQQLDTVVNTQSKIAAKKLAF